MRSPVNESQNDVIYRERVVPGIGAFIPLALILPTGYLTFTPINQALGFVIGIIATIVAVVALVVLSPVVELTKSSLRVGNATIPREALGAATAIAASDAFSERGPRLDARAFIRFQPTVKTLIKIEISDAKDPTPYCLFSTRHPQDLAKLINNA